MKLKSAIQIQTYFKKVTVFYKSFKDECVK